MSRTLRTSTRPTNCTSRACNTTSGVEGGHNRYRCRTRVRAKASRRSHTKSTKFRSFTHRCKGAMYSGTIVPHMNSSRHRAAALRAHRCTARSPQRAPFLFQQIARLQLSSSLKLSLHTAKHRLNTDFLRIEYTKSPGNEVNSTYNMAPLHGSVHQINLHLAISGLEATPRLVDIPLPTSEPSRQKRTPSPLLGSATPL